MNRTFGFPGPARDVAVFIDWMNIWLVENDMYAGNLTARQLLGRIMQQARKLGDRVSGAVYLNVGKLCLYNTLAWPALREAARELNVKVIDVPLQPSGQDDVDAVMMADMRHLNRFPNQDVRFALVTADKHFIPVVREIRQTRGIYLLVPTNARLPEIAWEGMDWRWVDWVAWRHIAVYDAACPDDPPGPSYLEFALRRWRSYRESFLIMQQIISMIDDLPCGLNRDEFIRRLQAGTQNFTIPDEAWSSYLEALEFYDVITIRQPGHLVRINREHPAFARTARVAAK